MSAVKDGIEYSVATDGPQLRLDTNVRPGTSKNGEVCFSDLVDPGEYEIHYQAYHCQYGDIEVVWPVHFN